MLAWGASGKAWLIGLDPHSCCTAAEYWPPCGGGRGEGLPGSVLPGYLEQIPAAEGSPLVAPAPPGGLAPGGWESWGRVCQEPWMRRGGRGWTSLPL